MLFFNSKIEDIASLKKPEHISLEHFPLKLSGLEIVLADQPFSLCDLL